MRDVGQPGAPWLRAAIAAIMPLLPEDAQLERHRSDARATLQALATTLSGGDRARVEARIADLDSARSIEKINEIAAEIRQEVQNLAAQAADDAVDYADERRAAQQRINAMHHDLYASDAEYRAQIDQLTGAADADRAAADARDAQVDALLREHGIETSVDGELEDIRRRRTEAAASGNAQEVFALDAEINRLRLQQLEEARAEAERLGLTEVVTVLDGEEPQRRREASDAEKRFDKAATAYLDAVRRKYQAEGLSAEEIDEKVKAEQKQLDAVRKGLQGKDELLDQRAERIEGWAKDEDKKAEETLRLPVAEAMELPAAAPQFVQAAPRDSSTVVSL